MQAGDAASRIALDVQEQANKARTVEAAEQLALVNRRIGGEDLADPVGELGQPPVTVLHIGLDPLERVGPGLTIEVPARRDDLHRGHHRRI